MEAELAAVQSDRESDQQSQAAARSELEVGLADHACHVTNLMLDPRVLSSQRWG